MTTIASVEALSNQRDHVVMPNILRVSDDRDATAKVFLVTPQNGIVTST